MILSFVQAENLLNALAHKYKEISVSLDLGITEENITISDKGFHFPDGQILNKKKVEKIAKKNTSCFFIENNDIVKIQTFSTETNKYYKLLPTKSWPSIEIAGIRMHCVKEIEKIRPEKQVIFCRKLPAGVV